MTLRNCTAKKAPATFTGKLWTTAAARARRATGFGGVYVFKKRLKPKWAEFPKAEKSSIQGFGNVATFFADAAKELGLKIIGAVRFQGGIYSADGIVQGGTGA